MKAFSDKVIKNVKNTLYAKRDGLVVFTSPEILGASNEIILEDESTPVFVYL